jgi:SGNH hydrolase-like domain, acetyltransferase AlgX
VKKILLLFGVLFGGLLVTELICRLVMEDPLKTESKNSRSWRVEGLVTDPELAYSFQPEYSGRMRLEGEYDLPFHINGQGLRDEVDFPSEHPGVQRILLLGDSFVFGVGVPFEDTLGEQLERALNTGEEGSEPVEVVAAGVPGYGPDDYALLAERWVPRLHPDLVVVAFFTGNDIYDCNLKRSDPKVVVDGYMVSRRQAWSYGIRKYSVLANLALQSFSPYGRTEEPRAKHVTPAAVELMCRSMYPWLSRLAAVSQDGGPPVAALLLYGKDYLSSLHRSGKGYEIKGLPEVLASMRHLGITVLDPLEIWLPEDATVERYFFPRDAHHTAAGNHFVAEWLASALRQQFPPGADAR